MGVSQQSKLNTHGFTKEYSTYIFNLDGILFDSLQDSYVNYSAALKMHGMPERAIGEARRFVGNDVKKLMERAIPSGLDNPDFEVTYADFRRHYLVRNLDNTKPYPGILELLANLHAHSKKLAVVSNKFYDATQDLYRHFFSDYATVAIGERENIKEKPVPDTVLEALRQLDDDGRDVVYVGDSDVDIATARNSNMPCISVLRGFKDKEFLLEHGATTFVSSPKESML